MKLPSFPQWKQLFKTFTIKEKISLLFLTVAVIGSISVLVSDYYYKNTRLVPEAKGQYAEGEIGSPRFLNPIYSESYDVDRDITELLFSGLTKYDENGKVVLDLARDYKISEDGKTYEFYLKENLFWSDGQRLTAEDIAYTIRIISDPAYKSPLRARWLGVEVEKISEKNIRFKLKNPYASFLETCTVKIIPLHIWQNVSADNFPLSQFNLQPVGSGPYQLARTNKTKDGKISSVDLSRNLRYYGQKPYIDELSFVFFDDYESLITAFKRGVIKGFAANSSAEKNINNSFIGINIYSFSFPRYFAAFFNPEKAKILNEQPVRQAFNYATDKKELLDKEMGGAGKIVESPMLPEFYGLNVPTTVYNYDPVKAAELFDKAGYKLDESGKRVKVVEKKPAFQFTKNMSTGSTLNPDIKELQQCLQKEVAPDLTISGNYGSKTKEAVAKFQEKYRADILDPSGISNPTGEVLKTTRAKLNEICFPTGEQHTPLKVVISTVDQPTMTKVAKTLAAQWEKAGIETEIQSFDISTLEREVIKPRNYEILLFGEVLGAIPDPYPFWHSSQKIDPGLNLSLYENKNCDKLLKEVRETLDDKTRKDKLELIQNMLNKDAPAVFLYNPDYFYLTSSEVKGIKAKMIIDPSKRFAGAENWYLKETRVWK